MLSEVTHWHFSFCLSVHLRFYWLMNLNATAVFLGISYIQHSGAWVLVLLIPFMSALMALITLHMMHCNVIYQPEKCKSVTFYINFLVFMVFLTYLFPPWFSMTSLSTHRICRSCQLLHVGATEPARISIISIFF